MSLNVREIEAHEFAMVKRAYNPEEVRSYLRKVANSVKEAPGRAFGDVGDRVASVFESADKAANEIKDAAEREPEAGEYVSYQTASVDRMRADVEERTVILEKKANQELADAHASASAVRKQADADALRGAPDIDGLTPQAALPDGTTNGGYNQNYLDR